VRRAPLPDDAERAAGRLAAFALAGRPDSAAAMLEALTDDDEARRQRGEPPTGLADNGRELLAAAGGPAAYSAQAERMLEQAELDPALRRRLQAYLDSQPLRVAERRMRESRRARVGAVVNRVTAPFSRFLFGGTLNPIESGRAALASLLVVHSLPDLTVQERQALRAYQEFLDRNPDAREAPEVVARVDQVQARWTAHMEGEALAVARRALDAGQPEIALWHLDRAERLDPDSAETPELRARARAELEERESNLVRSLEATALVGAPLDRRGRDAFAELAAAAISGPLEEVAARAHEWELRHRNGPLGDEGMFLEAFSPLARGDEDAFFDELREVAKLGVKRSNMARHALHAVADPGQNPWAYYQATRRLERRQLAAWLALGSRMRGPVRRELPRPIELLLDLPGIAVEIATFPLRLVRIGQMRSRLAGPRVHAGETYLARFPHGVHAQEIHAELEKRYAARGDLSQALAHHRALADVDPARVARYRGDIAARTLEAAGQQRRPDVRAAIYNSIVEQYPETPQAAQAQRELAKLVSEHTPQRVTVSKDFLLEHRELTGPDALGIRGDLLDGDDDNGELAESGITLVGLNLIRLDLVGREAQLERVPREPFARAVALLEEISYQALATDPRERAAPDPQRDAFFEQARLGLLDAADPRPSSMSEASFRSSREKYGSVLRRESILPVELVVQGGLEDFGVSAFPRLRMPAESPDAFLYQ
jgi:hypothetical protein